MKLVVDIEITFNAMISRFFRKIFYRCPSLLEMPRRKRRPYYGRRGNVEEKRLIFGYSINLLLITINLLFWQIFGLIHRECYI